MRFREEVLAKIFTYITVAVLLGIVAFEAWGLSRERSRRKDAEDNAAVLQEEVENMRDINSTLKKENGELSAFRNKWNVYVSSLTSSEVLELQHDLFMRTDLIPQEAKEEIATRNGKPGFLRKKQTGKVRLSRALPKIKRRKRIPKAKRQTTPELQRSSSGNIRLTIRMGKIFFCRSAPTRATGRIV